MPVNPLFTWSFILFHFFFHLVSQPTVSQSLPIILALLFYWIIYSANQLIIHTYSIPSNHLIQSFLQSIQAVSMSVNLSVTALLFLFQFLVYLEVWGQSLIHPSFGQSTSVMVNLHCQLD